MIITKKIFLKTLEIRIIFYEIKKAHIFLILYEKNKFIILKNMFLNADCK